MKRQFYRPLMRELAAIKKRGFAVNRGERELEVAAIAAPIFNHQNEVECALAVVGPVQRFSPDKGGEIVSKLLKAPGRISQALGAPVEERGKI